MDPILLRARTWSAVREMGAASLLAPLPAKLDRAIRKELNSDERIEFDKGVRDAADFLNGKPAA